MLTTLLTAALASSVGSFQIDSCTTASCDVTDQVLDAVENCEVHNIRDHCKVVFGTGNYVLTETINLCGAMTIEGQSSSHTYIRTTDTAFHLPPFDTCDAQSRRYSGKGVFRGFTLLSNPVSQEHIGILAHHSIRAENVIIGDYGIGIVIQADVTVSPRSNANAWVINNVRIYNTAHSGFWVDGGDSNAGVATMLYITGPHCTNPAPLMGQYASCAGIYDSSFLGNTYIAPHVAAVRNGYRAVETEGPNGRNTFIGMYNESDSEASWVTARSVSLGGLNSAEGEGFILHGVIANRLIMRNSRDPNNVAELWLGAQATPGAFFTVKHQNGIWPLNFTYFNDGYWFNAAGYGPSSKEFFHTGATSSEFQGLWDAPSILDSDLDDLMPRILNELNN